MKIDNQTSFGLFKNRKPGSGASVTGKTSALGAGRTDQNAIARGQTTMPDRQMLLLKSSVQDYVSAPADPARLEEIREGVQNGGYHVPTDQIVDAILDDGNGV
jgi:anti-sigma28 factor (negative regulator of flagellin synthesis)